MKSISRLSTSHGLLLDAYKMDDLVPAIATLNILVRFLYNILRHKLETWAWRLPAFLSDVTASNGINPGHKYVDAVVSMDTIDFTGILQLYNYYGDISVTLMLTM